MQTKEQLFDLANRVEACREPNRQIDVEIAIALGKNPQYIDLEKLKDPAEEKLRDLYIKRYTKSIDAAEELVPDSPHSSEMYNVERWNESSFSVYAKHIKATAWVPGAARVFAANPAIALSTAAIRATAQLMG